MLQIIKWKENGYANCTKFTYFLLSFHRFAGWYWYQPCLCPSIAHISTEVNLYLLKGAISACKTFVKVGCNQVQFNHPQAQYYTTHILTHTHTQPSSSMTESMRINFIQQFRNIFNPHFTG